MQKQIVEAALKRFTHFGIDKTTLTEIAEDLGISKQTLSYYFHDKQSLVYALVDKITTEYGKQLKLEMEQPGSVENALLKLTKVKGVFFKKYFLLITQAEHLDFVNHGSFKNWRKFLLDKESGLLTKLFDSGVNTGELEPLDAQKTAELLLDTLYAFSKCVKEKGALPNPALFDEVLLKQQEVIKIFYKAIKQHHDSTGQ